MFFFFNELCWLSVLKRVLQRTYITMSSCHCLMKGIDCQSHVHDCVCLYWCVCMFVCACVHMHACTHYMCVYMWTCMCVHCYVSLFVCVYLWIRSCMDCGFASKSNRKVMMCMHGGCACATVAITTRLYILPVSVWMGGGWVIAAPSQFTHTHTHPKQRYL